MTTGRGRILLVEDKPNMLALLEQMLREHYDVTSARDGKQALDILGQQAFDVVLTDVRMPGADGLEILRAVKDRDPTTEVIVMTAFASIEAAVEAIKAGAYDYLRKPFDPDDVLLVLSRALENARARALPSPASQLSSSGAGDLADPLSVSFKDAVNRASEEASREYLRKLMATFAGNVTQAAQRAGLQRESLHRLLKRYGLRAESFRGKIDPDGDDPSDT
jgi:DNA-binding NtrC family response regulator